MRAHHEAGDMAAHRAPGLGRPAAIRLGLAVLLAGVVTAALIVAGRLHTPNYTASIFGRTGVAAISLKSWLATVTLALAGLQVLLALWMYGKLPWAGSPSRAVAVTHRLNGVVLIAVTIPVAVHCLIAYGVQLTSLRVGVHSLVGCFLYGAFAAKVLLVRSRRLPGWVLPVAGGTLAVVIAVLWYTAALWYFHGYRLPGL
jgi:hypothetical protein